MNYIQEIKSFNDWLILNPSVSSDDIVLWYALMNLNNMSGWQKEFTVAISTIMDRTRLSRSAIYRSRNKLVQLGRIKTRERSGNQCSIYEVIPFASYKGTHDGTDNGTQQPELPIASPNETQTGMQTETQTGTHAATQPETINKTKLNNLIGEDDRGANAPPPDKPKKEKKVFVPPTKDEVLFFIDEQLNKTHHKREDIAQEFFDYYQANGWKVGKNKMSDWKAAMRNCMKWEKVVKLINSQAPKQIKAVDMDEYLDRQPIIRAV